MNKAVGEKTVTIVISQQVCMLAEMAVQIEFSEAAFERPNMVKDNEGDVKQMHDVKKTTTNAQYQAD